VSVTAARGFVAAGATVGLKSSGAPDVALVSTADQRAVPAAGVFTRNLMTAAPVQVSRANLEATGGYARGVILNSGNANAATGEPGLAHANQMTSATGAALGCDGDDVLVCSTGLIGIPLPVQPILDSVPALVADLSGDGGHAAATAIMTTDTVAKEVVVACGDATVGGMAKGAAMLAPNMATMLAVLTTDAEADPAMLAAALRHGVDDTFNALIVDGAMSTNDTVLLLAGGLAGPVSQGDLDASVREACASLAHQMAADAEGATKVVRIVVTGATDPDDARTAARQVAVSQLTKCSWYGERAYWGRVASDVGSSGAQVDQARMRVDYGGVTVAAGGVAVAHDLDTVVAHMEGRDLEITVDLGLGTGRAEVLTTDLSHAYIDENMGDS
jgi:glutamate N-acetyltransferase/amino-acid N-acetyltransferase